MSKKLGILYGISVGTGDPELITVKGLRLLQKVSIVAFPAGINNKPGIAQQIIAPWLKVEQITLSLSFPYVQDEQELQQAWLKAAMEILPHLQQGQDVAFACEGDISFYSTFTYLAQTILDYDPQIKIETVPGICSPMAATSVLGIPLTKGSDRLVIVPALYHIEHLDQIFKNADVVVLLKVSSVYDQVWQILQQFQLLQRSWVVERATQRDQKIYNDLSDRPQLQLSYFSLLIVKVS
ncbi:precorrin-2 C(20)-methyltransferase [Aphanothece sacrum]|uniref:Precorrin-2 methyltransferase n=1 Tax=Aphanothece sacrum FPU1 TaxID=1920663 RepID=A0A401IMF2_APHSA|nr:precorrin-2 C(20)-methyltransferase [Aphanothece sacrum]GBF82432.1 precorrin-2 methyltransferase [Aphanothece sacrum FPU1]GBF84413.1 precorrin-2 methyltransferase [Aphanothece sacrum FPU3]